MRGLTARLLRILTMFPGPMITRTFRLRRRRPTCITQLLRQPRSIWELATSIGVELTFAVDKSAVLLPSLCVRRPAPCTPLNPQGLPGYVLNDGVSGSQHFCLSWTYIAIWVYSHGKLCVSHGGCFSSCTGAYCVAPPGVRALLLSQCSADYPVHLLRSLVLSRFVFSCAITDLTCTIHRRNWCKH